MLGLMHLTVRRLLHLSLQYVLYDAKWQSLHSHGAEQWITMPHHLIFLAIHFTISKRMLRRIWYAYQFLTSYLAVYANSFLATYVPTSYYLLFVTQCVTCRLNSRATLRARSMSGSRSGDPPSFPTLLTDVQRRGSSGVS